MSAPAVPPVSRSSSRQPATAGKSRTPAPRRAYARVAPAPSGGGAKFVVAGLLILGVMGYVGYRTQVLGEPLSQVLRLPGANSSQESVQAGPAEGGEAGKTGFSGAPVAGKTHDGNDTLFGRRSSSPSR